MSWIDHGQGGWWHQETGCAVWTIPSEPGAAVADEGRLQRPGSHEVEEYASVELAKRAAEAAPPPATRAPTRSQVDKIVGALVAKPGLLFEVKQRLAAHRLIGPWKEITDSEGNPAWTRTEAGTRGSAIAIVGTKAGTAPGGPYTWKALTREGKTRTGRVAAKIGAMMAADNSLRKHGDYTFVEDP